MNAALSSLERFNALAGLAQDSLQRQGERAPEPNGPPMLEGPKHDRPGSFRWEGEMAPLVESCAETFLRSAEGYDAVLAEVPAAVGIVDLLVVKFDPEAVAARESEQIPAIPSSRKIQVLDLLGVTRWRRVESVARQVGSTPTGLTRSTLTPLAELGVVELDGPRVRSTGIWSPLATRVTAIELKLSKWRAALRQADNFALSSDHAWVVLDQSMAHRVGDRVARFRAEGIGLAGIDPAGNVTVIARPLANRRPAIRWLRALMAERAWGALNAPACELKGGSPNVQKVCSNSIA